MTKAKEKENCSSCGGEGVIYRSCSGGYDEVAIQCLELQDKPVFVSIRRELMDEVIGNLKIGLGFSEMSLFDSRYYADANRVNQIESETKAIRKTIEKLEKHL